jgi:prepilin-type N-terminal cleavage/methylation domain-containing protein
VSPHVRLFPAARRAPRPVARPVARERRGLTLVEVIVAIILLAVGLLSLARLAASAAIAVRGGGTQVVAAAVAQSRFDSLMSVPCAGLATGGNRTTGTSLIRGVRESWSVTDGQNIKRLADTIQIPGRTRPVVYQSVIPCRD